MTPESTTAAAAPVDWISGRPGYARGRRGWRVVSGTGGVTVVPSWKPGGLMLVFTGVLGVATVAVFGRAIGDFDSPLGVFFWVLSRLFAAVFAAVDCVLLVLAARLFRDAARGPMAAWNRADGSVDLPRTGERFIRQQIVGWRAVSGHFVGFGDARIRRDDPMSELQLIVTTDGRPAAYPVAGTLAPSITPEANALAALTGLPLEIVRQPEGVHEPTYVPSANSWRGS